MKKIAVLTSGGDAPGMNACIRAIVRTGLYHGLEVFGVERGYQGLIEDWVIPMQSTSVSNIIQRGGTILKTARSIDFRTTDGRIRAYQNLQRHGIEGLVAIGGNGTYMGAQAFFEEFGMPIIGVPGTIDNDLFGTDSTIGFDTAVNTALEAIDRIRDTADSSDRMFFVEVMGRHTGYIALEVGIAGGAEAIVVPEVHTDADHIVTLLQQGWGRKKTSQLVIVAEGDDTGGVFNVVERIKEKVPELNYRVTVLGHIQRGGSPSANDRVLASRLGAAAVEALLSGRKNEAVGVVNGEISFVSIADAIQKSKPLNDKLLQLAEILGL
jgi:6-phosphofructokinase 1